MKYKETNYIRVLLCECILHMSTKALCVLFIVVSIVAIGIYYSLYQPYTTSLFQINGHFSHSSVNKTGKTLANLRRTSHLDLRSFNISGHDVMVFLHIQKTGGTFFGQNLVKNLVLERQCARPKSKNILKRFECKRPKSNEFWLYSRYSTGWICGLHADWTTLTSCIPKVLKTHLGTKNKSENRLFYVSLLRDPVNRFLSEFKHVQRGATWKTSTLICNGTNYHLPLCYTGSDWRGVQLPEFLDCAQNPAMNRQTRMLANLSYIGCYNYHKTFSSLTREYEKNMLKSAKNTLRALSYFGLLEYQKESQYLFEMTFGLKFQKDFRQIADSDTWSNEAREDVNPKQLLQIRKMNRLDRQLYSYARTLFFKRLKYFEILN